MLALLNSKLFNWFYQNIINPELGEALAQVKRGHLANLPIKHSDESDAIAYLAGNMLKLNERLNSTKTPQDRKFLEREIKATDRQINQLVYKLYELMPEEVALVENESKTTQLSNSI